MMPAYWIRVAVTAWRYERRYLSLDDARRLVKP